MGHKLGGSGCALCSGGSWVPIEHKVVWANIQWDYLTIWLNVLSSTLWTRGWHYFVFQQQMVQLQHKTFSFISPELWPPTAQIWTQLIRKYTQWTIETWQFIFDYNSGIWNLNQFLQRAAMLALQALYYSYDISVCLSVCPSVTRWYGVKTTARSTVQFALSDSKMYLVL